jgi:hypothetical protein
MYCKNKCKKQQSKTVQNSAIDKSWTDLGATLVDDMAL